MSNGNDIQLTLALADVNRILEALGQLPYAQVYQLIGTIQQQAEAQLQAPTAQPEIPPPLSNASSGTMER